MSMTAISSSSFDYTGTMTTPKNAANTQATAQVTVAMSSTTVDTYNGPTYTNSRLGMSGVRPGDTINGVAIEAMADSKMTTFGSVSESQETSLSLSYSSSGSSGSEDIELSLDSSSTSESVFGPGGSSSAEVAAKLLEEASDQGASNQGGQQSHPGQAYDTTA